MIRRTLLAAAIITIAAPSFAQNYNYLSDKEMKAGSKLYRINLGKGLWRSLGTEVPAGTSLAQRSRKKSCGAETYFLIKTDFNNDFAYATTEQFFERVKPDDVTPMVTRMYYPDGEIIEREPVIRGKLGNTQAYRAQYRVNWASGKSYYMYYYLTFAHGYFVHITGYTRLPDRVLAKPCFEEVLSTLRFAPDTPPEESKP